MRNISIPGTHNSPTNLRLPDEARCAESKRRGAPSDDEVMLEALRGGGYTDLGMTIAVRLWKHLLPEIERLEQDHITHGGRIDEVAISSMVRRTTEGILARHRYAASLKHRRRGRCKKR